MPPCRARASYRSRIEDDVSVGMQGRDDDREEQSECGALQVHWPLVAQRTVPRPGLSSSASETRVEACSGEARHHTGQPDRLVPWKRFL